MIYDTFNNYKKTDLKKDLSLLTQEIINRIER